MPMPAKQPVKTQVKKMEEVILMEEKPIKPLKGAKRRPTSVFQPQKDSTKSSLKEVQFENKWDKLEIAESQK